MENLTIEDTPPQGAPGGAQIPLLGPGIPPPQNQQLPPQMFTTAAQLLDMTDSKDFFDLFSSSISYGTVSLLSVVCVEPHDFKESPGLDDIYTFTPQRENMG
jgi:hypothetical protein